jgi:hypothetical protein
MRTPNEITRWVRVFGRSWAKTVVPVWLPVFLLVLAPPLAHASAILLGSISGTGNAVGVYPWSQVHFRFQDGDAFLTASVTVGQDLIRDCCGDPDSPDFSPAFSTLSAYLTDDVAGFLDYHLSADEVGPLACSGAAIDDDRLLLGGRLVGQAMDRIHLSLWTCFHPIPNYPQEGGWVNASYVVEFWKEDATPVPEPDTVLLLVHGLAGLGLLALRRGVGRH